MVRPSCERVGSRALPLGLWALSLAVASPIAAAAGGVDALLALSPLRCPLLLLTGLHCPTCGLGHALVHAWTFDLAGAWAHHPLGALLLPASGALALAWWLGPQAVRRVGCAIERQLLRRTAALLATVALYVAWNAVRLG